MRENGDGCAAAPGRGTPEESPLQRTSSLPAGRIQSLGHLTPAEGPEFTSKAMAAPDAAPSLPTDNSNIGDQSSINAAIRISRSDESYYPFVAEQYPAATDGDPDSQFLVWRLMEACRPHHYLFSSDSFEEVLSRLKAPSPATIERLRRTWARCSELHAHTSDFLD
ncbi:hypothetical protein [Lentisalinibacter orientalis]|uniref:hypothetical protein n=1 Tax=Lentisalinibacter orientalis TaxID=2992241 RepID=UPI003864957D